MKFTRGISIFGFVLALSCFSNASLSQSMCQNPGSDPDGDGWGWENGASCIMPAITAATTGTPLCSASAVDFDNDGWAFENGRSCTVVAGSNTASSGSSTSVSPSAARALAGIPACSAAAVDFDGDGWGFENGNSCLVGGVAGTTDSGNSTSTGNSSSQSSRTPTGMSFNSSTLRRVRGSGDNWCQTWAADGSVITAMDDGDWLNTGSNYHSRLYRMFGDANNFSRSEIDNYPNFSTHDDGWFAYGILSVKGVLYSLVSKAQGVNWSTGPFRGMKMLRSYDNGNNWHRVDRNNNDRYLDRWDIGREELSLSEMFFFEESGRFGSGRNAYPFSYASFVQSGQDHRASQDGFVYIYSPEGARANQLQLARVPEDQVGNRSAWQYFSGWNGNTPTWSGNIEARQPNMVLPERNNAGQYFGWYSWLPSVVWNPGLQKYIMANGGTYAGRNFSQSNEDYYDRFMHHKTGSLGFWHSDTPYGPWTQFYYNDNWTVDDSRNLTYQPKLSPKWISDDGRTMTLIWSDAQRNDSGNSHSVNYTWNQIEIQIQTR